MGVFPSNVRPRTDLVVFSFIIFSCPAIRSILVLQKSYRQRPCSRRTSRGGPLLGVRICGAMTSQGPHREHQGCHEVEDHETSFRIWVPYIFLLRGREIGRRQQGEHRPALLWTGFIGPVGTSIAATIDGSWYLRYQSS